MVRLSDPTPPEPIPDEIRKTLNLQPESDRRLIQLAVDEDAVLICAVAPYRSVRVSPVAEMRASIGLHEEFAFEAVIDEINEQKMANKKLMLLLNSLGGGLHSSFKVARALRQSFSEIEVYVPHIAASGGTLIALVGDKIVMGLMSQLSPLDPQVRHKGGLISALTFKRAYDRLCEAFGKKLKEEAPYPEQALADKLDPFLMEDWNATIESAEQYATEILQLAKYDDEKASTIAHKLIHEFHTHDADINYGVAEELGLRVEKHDASERNARVWRLLRAWLGTFLFLESPTHIIRYILPKATTEGRDEGKAT